ncbi:hypothetical protein HPP92_003994 [Vanilla planifolia]|uniref:Uncharacterized protein n=1 Tax=Vanilla planifolia TaxID=51239 RepID=A0A835RYP1_VANPL|nr:hypothetical protein HPP92_003994 [Vanilla planifolia]
MSPECNQLYHRDPGILKILHIKAIDETQQTFTLIPQNDNASTSLRKVVQITEVNRAQQNNKVTSGYILKKGKRQWDSSSTATSLLNWDFNDKNEGRNKAQEQAKGSNGNGTREKAAEGKSDNELMHPRLSQAAVVVIQEAYSHHRVSELDLIPQMETRFLKCHRSYKHSSSYTREWFESMDGGSFRDCNNVGAWGYGFNGCGGGEEGGFGRKGTMLDRWSGGKKVDGLPEDVIKKRT